MKCPNCDRLGLKVYEPGEMAYTINQYGTLIPDRFYSDEGVGATIECVYCDIQYLDNDDMFIDWPHMKLREDGGVLGGDEEAEKEPVPK